MKQLWLGVMNEPEAIAHLQKSGYDQAEETLRRLHSLRNSTRYKQLPELSRQRFDGLMPVLIQFRRRNRILKSRSCG